MLTAPHLFVMQSQSDLLRGIDAFFESPLDVPVAHIPAGITFPSVKDRSHAGARQQPSHHSCQILVPAQREHES